MWGSDSRRWSLFRRHACTRWSRDSIGGCLSTLICLLLVNLPLLKLNSHATRPNFAIEACGLNCSLIVSGRISQQPLETRPAPFFNAFEPRQYRYPVRPLRSMAWLASGAPADGSLSRVTDTYASW
jgi:hypothetical protein